MTASAERPATATTPTVSLAKARDFVYEHGVLWERALFAHLFDGGGRDRVLRCLALHQNDDGGWGDAHGLPQWRPLSTIHALKTLQAHRRLPPTG